MIKISYIYFFIYSVVMSLTSCFSHFRQLAVRHILKSLQSLESDRDGVETIFALVKESFVDDKG